MPILLAASVLAATLSLPAPSVCDESVETTVPLVQLIANPDRWHGKEVKVIGFARFEYEGDALYLSESDYRLGRSDSAIALYVPYFEYGKQVDSSIQTQDHDRKYVVAQGMFHAHRDRSVRMVAAHTGALGPLCMLASWDLRRE
jgi:hypothetical protein